MFGEGLYSQHFIFFLTYELTEKARVFLPVKPFQPSVMYSNSLGISLQCYAMLCSFFETPTYKFVSLIIC